MFRQLIGSTALTSEAANIYFEHIRGESFHGDFSFLSTLRALIAPRMAENERLDLRFASSSHSAATINESQPKRLIESACGINFKTLIGTIYVHNANSRKPEDNTVFLDMIKSNFAKVNNGWHRLAKVTDLFRTQFYTLCFINPELKSVAVFVENLSVSKMHYLQCAILGFFPWYFSPEKGVSKLEMELINTLRGKDSNEYSACIAQIAERYDFRTAIIKQKLAGFETRYEKLECDRVRMNITSTDNTISRLNSDISRELEKRREFEIRLLGLEAKIAEGVENSEIMDYFIRNKKLELDYVDDRHLGFVVKDYITYFNEDLAKRMIENPRSFIYRPDSSSGYEYIPSDKMKELMQAIFIDQIIKIKVCAAYDFNLTGNVEGISGYNFGPEYACYIPNPHIQYFSCMGGYSRPINEALQNHDYISALEQTIASAKNINFGDSVVMNRFMRKFYGMGESETSRARNKCVELPDGTLVTPAQAADWVWAQNHTEGQEGTADE